MRDRVWSLVAIGATAALIAALLGHGAAARGVLAGTPVGVLNHGLTRLAAARWRGPSAGAAAWMMGASALRLVVAGAALVWAATRGPEFLIGVLVGLLVDVLDHSLRLPASLRRSPGAAGHGPVKGADPATVRRGGGEG